MTQTTEITPQAPEREKIWAHSGDSHAMEPADLWTSRLPKRLADRAPRTERGEKYEIVYVDGQQLSRQLNDFMDAIRPPELRTSRSGCGTWIKRASSANWLFPRRVSGR